VLGVLFVIFDFPSIIYKVFVLHLPDKPQRYTNSQASDTTTNDKSIQRIMEIDPDPHRQQDLQKTLLLLYFCEISTLLFLIAKSKHLRFEKWGLFQIVFESLKNPGFSKSFYLSKHHFSNEIWSSRRDGVFEKERRRVRRWWCILGM